MAVANRSWVILAVSWPLFGICAILTLLRIWVRTHIIRSSWGWDDAFIVLAMLCASTNTALATTSAHYGSGQHAADLSEYQRVQSTKFNWLSQGFHVMSTNWGKVSVALFLLRIIDKVKHHRPVVLGGIVFLTIVNSVCVFTIYGQCSPTARLWDADVEGTCWEPSVQKNYAFFQGSTSALSDLVLAVYPLFFIWNLQMATKVKVGLGFVLSLGIIAMIAAIVKTINLASLSARADYPWDTVDLTIWIAVEQYLIIIAACIPTLTPLFNIAVRHRSSRKNSTPNQKGVVSRSRQSGRSRLTPHPYAPFSSAGTVGKEQGYPLAWMRSERITKIGTGTGSDSEDPIMGVGNRVENGDRDGNATGRLAEVKRARHGILLTTEIHVQTASESEYGDEHGRH
ncbi:hypothetical protein BJX70DRAFT_361843 [Aspergillus crustosus]